MPFPRLSRSSMLVAAIGLGGAGSHVVQQVSHVGIETIGAADPGTAELSNLNRLIGATHAVRGRLKTEIAASRAKAVNPDLRIKKFPMKWQEAMA